MRPKTNIQSKLRRMPVPFVILLLALLTGINSAHAAVITLSSGSTYSGATWSGGSPPTSSDDVVIPSGVTFDFDADVTVNSLTIGDATGSATTVTVNSANKLIITGNLSMNPNGNAAVYRLNAQGGTLEVGGSPIFGSTSCSIILGSGAIRFNNSSGISWSSGTLQYSGGSVTFASTLTQNSGTIINSTTAGTITFSGGFTHSGGTYSDISGTTHVMGGDLTINSGSSFTLNSGSTLEYTGNSTTSISSGTLQVGNLKITGVALTLSNSITLTGNWTNNGGSLSGGTNTVFFSGSSASIDGTSSTSFPNISITNSGVVTLSTSASCINLGFQTGNQSNSLTHRSGISLAVSGSVSIFQTSSTVTTKAWNINDGSATVAGNVVIGDVGTTAGWVAKVKITTGSLSISGNLVFGNALAASAAPDNAVLEITGAGSVTLGGSLTVNPLGGTLSPGTGTFTYNGSAAQTVTLTSNITYNNLVIANSHANGATLGNTATASNLTGDLSVTGGIFKNGGYDITLAAGKNFSVSAGATFTLTGSSGMVTVSGGSKTFATTSTVNYSGTSQSISSESYGNLTISGTSAAFPASDLTVNNLTVTGSATANANIQCNASFSLTGGTFNAGSNTLTVKGSFTNSSGTFNAGTGTVDMSGTASSVAIAASGTFFYNLIISNTNNGGVAASSSFSVSNILLLQSACALVPASTAVISGTGTMKGPASGLPGVASVTKTGSANDFTAQYTITPDHTNLNVDFRGNFVQQKTTTTSFGSISISNLGGLRLDAPVSLSLGMVLYAGAINNSTNNITLANGATIARYNGSLTAAPVFGSTVHVSYLNAADITAGNELPASSSVLGNLKMVQTGSTIYKVTLNKSITVNDTLVLTKGWLVLGSFDLTLGTATRNANNNSYVRVTGTGRLKRTLASNTSGIFPIGGSSLYMPLTVQSVSGGDFAAGIFSGVTDSVGGAVSANTLSHTWNLNATSGAADVVITPSWPGSAELTGFSNSQAFVAYRTAPTVGWKASSNPVGASFSNPFYSVASGAIDLNSATDYEIAVGDDVSFVTPLPVELIRFTAKNSGQNKVYLQWATATELNNSHFEVQRSADGVNFLSVGKVQGNGTRLTETNYSFSDQLDGRPASSVIYYRLKQVDYNGAFEYSPIRRVVMDGNAPAMTAWFNSSTQTIQFETANTLAEQGEIALINMQGQEVYRSSVQLKSSLPGVDVSAILAGIYLVSIKSTDGQVSSTKISITH